MSSYLSYAQQSLHYFSRLHEKPLLSPLIGPATWRGPELRERRDWREHLDEAQVEELEAALAAARATGKPTGELGAADFPLPTLAAEVAPDGNAGWMLAIHDYPQLHALARVRHRVRCSVE